MTSRPEAPPELPDSFISEPESSTPTPEQLFGKEVLTPDDVRDISKNIHGLLEENSPESVYQAARQLTHMKRPGFEMKNPKWQEYMAEKFSGQQEAMRQAPPRDHARYLTFIKYITERKDRHNKEGGIAFAVKAPPIEDEDKERLQLAAIAAERENRTNDLASLAVMNKYLGVTPEVSAGTARALQGTVETKQQAGKTDQLAFTMGRLKYLDIATGLSPQAQQAAEVRISTQANAYLRAGKTTAYSALANLHAYISGKKSVVSAEAGAKIGTAVRALRERVKNSSGWVSALAAYADGRRLERQTSGADTAIANDEVAVFLSQLEQTHQYVSPEERFAARGRAEKFNEKSVIDDEEPRSGTAETATLSTGDTAKNVREKPAVEWYDSDGAIMDINLPEDVSNSNVFDDEVKVEVTDREKDAQSGPRVDEKINQPASPLSQAENNLKSDPKWQEMKKRVNRRVSLSLTRSAPERGELATQIYAEELNRFVEDNIENARQYSKKWDSFAAAAGINPDIGIDEWGELVDDNSELLRMYSYWSIAQAYKNWKSTSKK